MDQGRDRITREIDILGLRREAAEAAGEEMKCFESEDAPIEVQEAFWEHVVEYEKAPWTTHQETLAQDGIELLPPDELDDVRLPSALWSIIRAMAARNIYLHCTDHLSDRELYAWLCSEGLSEQYKAMPPGSGWNCHLDVVGSGSEEHTLLYMRYFADEESRASWLSSFPDYEMPEHEEPPYDRDRFLPQRVYEPPDDEWDEDMLGGDWGS